MTLGSSGDTLASENNNNLCSRELTGSEHMICLDCSDSVHLILPDKIGCVPSNYRGMFQGPKKEGDLQPSLRTFCPEGYAYLPTTEGGDCVPCLNSTCSRCLREDLQKCLGCRTDQFLRKDLNDSCSSSSCGLNQYLTAADGNKCVDFLLPGCNKSDSFGWCSRVSGEGCLSGLDYIAGVCCVETISNRDLSTFPAKCILCSNTCKSCSGTASNQCDSCPSFFNLRLSGSSCSTCNSSTCLKCDSDPNICEDFYTPDICQDRCNPVNCNVNGFQCNTSGCTSGYFRDSTGKCLLCGLGCNTCTTTITTCGSCRPNYTLSSSVCHCNSPKKANLFLQPNLCTNICPSSCAGCSVDNICHTCTTQFKLDTPNCVCKVANGFMLASASSCDRCLKGCQECSVNINTCSGTQCRTNYSGFPDCVCKIDEGFYENLFPAQGESKNCLSCTAGVGCHQCLYDLNVCSGCRVNFVLESNTCVCPITNGYFLDTTTSPHSCKKCLVQNCLSCMNDLNLCDTGGCRTNFLLKIASDSCNCPVGAGFILENPETCSACQVEFCSNCSSGVSQCEPGGCGVNFTQVDPATCICSQSGFRLNILTSPKSCEPCDVQNCHDCTDTKTECMANGCRQNFTRVSSSECSCINPGYGLNLGSLPLTCETCEVLNCEDCRSNKLLCEPLGCRSNFVRLDPVTCSCPQAEGFYLSATVPYEICTKCHSSCETCQGILDSDCLSCPIGKKLSNTPVGQCESVIATQLNIIRFDIKHLVRGEQSTLSDLVFQVTLFNLDGSKLTQNLSHYGITDLEIFELDSDNRISKLQFQEKQEKQFESMLVLATISDTEEGEIIKIKFTPNSKKYNQYYQLQGEPKTFSLNYEGRISSDELNQTEILGKTSSGLNTYGSAAFETVSFVFSYFSLDPSGSLLSLSQMMKIYSRFRFFHINYGTLLSAYFEFSANKFDPPTSLSLEQIAKHSKKFYGNLFWKKVALDIFEVDPIRISICGASWILKIIGIFLVYHAKNTDNITKSIGIFVSISQRIHMVSVNQVAMDLIPYTIITLLHSQRLAIFYDLSAVFFLVILVFDFCEIWSKGGNSILVEYMEEKPTDTSLANQDKDEFFGAKKNKQNKLAQDEEDPLVLDHISTIWRLEQNLAIQKFCTSHLKENQLHSKNQMLLMSHFSFLLKLSLMQTVFVGMSMLAIPGLVVLLTFEIVYLGYQLVPYWKHRHLRSVLTLIPKITQSVILLGIEILIITYYAQLQDQDFSLTKSQQNRLTKVIFVSNITEYAFLILNLLLIARTNIDQRRRKKLDERYKKHIEDCNSVFVYKKPEFPEQLVFEVGNRSAISEGFNIVGESVSGKLINQAEDQDYSLGSGDDPFRVQISRKRKSSQVSLKINSPRESQDLSSLNFQNAFLSAPKPKFVVSEEEFDFSKEIITGPSNYRNLNTAQKKLSTVVERHIRVKVGGVTFLNYDQLPRDQARNIR